LGALSVERARQNDSAVVSQNGPSSTAKNILPIAGRIARGTITDGLLLRYIGFGSARAF
jgi:hypothetical protein